MDNVLDTYRFGKRMYSLHYMEVEDLNKVSGDNPDDESVGDCGAYCLLTDDIGEIIEYCLKWNPNDRDKLNEWVNSVLYDQEPQCFPVDLSEFGEEKPYYNHDTICNPKSSSAWCRLQFAEIQLYTIDLTDESRYKVDCDYQCSCHGEPFYVERLPVDSYVLK